MDERTSAKLDAVLKRWAREIDGCLVWTGSLLRLRPNSPRHPRVHMNDRSWYVRRLVWEQAHGPIPPRTGVRFTCGNDLCVKLEHLALVPIGYTREHRRVATHDHLMPEPPPPPPPPPRVCPECGKDYDPTRSSQVYCTHDCQMTSERRTDMYRKRRERGGLKRAVRPV